jgi:O-antigen ligase
MTKALRHAGTEHPNSTIDVVLFYGLLVLLIFGPLAFGAVEPWAFYIMEMGAATLLGLWAVQPLRGGAIRVYSSPVFPPMIAFAVVVLLQLLLGRSAYGYVSQVSALQYCACGILSFIAVQTMRCEERIGTAATVISIFGSLLALFALVQNLTPNGKLYWLRTPAQGGWIFGPYVNHNHYAGLMEMLAPIPLVYSLSRFAEGAKKGVAAAVGILMAATIFLSGSRGGMVAFLVEMLMLAGFAVSAGIVKKQDFSRAQLAAGFSRAGLTGERGRRPAVVPIVALVMVFGVALWLGGSEVMHRVASIHGEAQTEISGGTRLTIDRDCLKMFAERPVLGWGLGTFATAYPQFRSFYTNLFVNQAHNDYLQLLAETGVTGFGVMLWFLVAVLRGASKRFDNWNGTVSGAVAVATLLGITGILVHSFVDFNLQIPANAAWFYVMCTLAAGAETSTT